MERCAYVDNAFGNEGKIRKEKWKSWNMEHAYKNDLNTPLSESKVVSNF